MAWHTADRVRLVLRNAAMFRAVGKHVTTAELINGVKNSEFDEVTLKSCARRDGAAVLLASSIQDRPATAVITVDDAVVILVSLENSKEYSQLGP